MKTKTLMRREISHKLASLPTTSKELQSKIITEKLIASNIFKNSSCVGVFLNGNMVDEVRTTEIVHHLFLNGKSCFVPRVLDNQDMEFFRVYSLEELSSFPINKWGIPEPPIIPSREKSTDTLSLDLLLVPGVAFDGDCVRIGRGKGYYDRFLTRYFELATNAGKTKPVLVGLAFLEQIVDKVPRDPHDILMDHVLTANSNL